MTAGSELGLFSPGYPIIWIMLALSICIFANGVLARVRVWTSGPSDKRRMSMRNLFLATAQGLRSTSRTRPSGHTVMVSSFIVFTAGTLSVAADEHLGLGIFRGTYYLVLSTMLDLLGLSCLVTALLLIRRRFQSNNGAINRRSDDFSVLLFISGISLTGFWLEGLRIAIENDVWANWSPVGKLFSIFFSIGDRTQLGFLRVLTWWIHLLLSFGFFAFIPYSKMFHIFTIPLNRAYAQENTVASLPLLDFDDESLAYFGISGINHLSRKQRLDTFACVNCGECQNHCPAYLTDKPLATIEFTLALKQMLLKGSETPIIPQAITDDGIWSCTTCGACDAVCPAKVETNSKIIGIRQDLVMSEGRFPSTAQQVFRGIEVNGNPWDIGGRTRIDSLIDAGVISPVGNKPPDLLFWLGCAGHFDARYAQVINATLGLLNTAGIAVATMGGDEQCCGDPARRLGNEYLFQAVAKENIKKLASNGIKRIVTSCPHCFNTLNHEYRQLGGTFEVFHHSVLLDSLVKQHILQPSNPLPATCTYHDSCYLGRYNNIFQAPRSALRSIPGLDVVEMTRSRQQAFCCGGGGGRMWLEEREGTRINANRAQQALGTGANLVVTACPFCLAMLENGMQIEEPAATAVKDVAEVLWESLLVGQTRANKAHEPA